MGDEFFHSATNMKLMQMFSAGYDRVDIEEARKAKVPFSNNGGTNAIAVAEHTIMLILAVLKRVFRFHNDVVAGKWRPGGLGHHKGIYPSPNNPRLRGPGNTGYTIAPTPAPLATAG